MEKQQIFPKLKLELSLEEKIKIITTRHDNNFLNQELEDIKENFPESVLPTEKVTQANLKEFLTRDSKSKINKLSWVMKSKEPFSIEFKNKINNEFKSIKDAQLAAAKLYSIHCEKYQKNKATSYSVDGKKKTSENVMMKNQILNLKMKEKLPKQ